MRFPYTTAISQDPDTKDYLFFRRPELHVRLVGPEGSQMFVGLVDTGSDRTIFPRDAADALGIELSQGPGGALGFGGHGINLLVGEGMLEIEADGERIAWRAEMWFAEFATEDDAVLLGHAGFLDYFRAEFDGEQSELTLLPNGQMPRE